ncbi:Schizosaccharomyces specific multicopy membrane protein family 1 [Schizosaccharomyces pombe]|uniref:Uncharacterized membrane protein C61.05 n=1 Tax=Schizosaccharomyces pombe (strain 972 / ATCC 24843) TaxID=284812 RepID=YCB5_SCHPO|nr:uncharacterized protein SPCC61.05 [Schizosaccharomyces pombe]O94349.1 RecName: Full=Uncharacterized membrane protein C61.05; Flags: Precursor [Schizosaccharomyces pombe 972h-]CAA22274.1 S. pombe specific multicopy membrane protein family 1 [Schizosaccharomyces pombe]|eukprot:NP_588196.1 uncharacterized protein SPCC61.05 [Schizosaccharomyces pombe]
MRINFVLLITLILPWFVSGDSSEEAVDAPLDVKDDTGNKDYYKDSTGAYHFDKLIVTPLEYRDGESWKQSVIYCDLIFAKENKEEKGSFVKAQLKEDAEHPFIYRLLKLQTPLETYRGFIDGKNTEILDEIKSINLFEDFLSESLVPEISPSVNIPIDETALYCFIGIQETEPIRIPWPVLTVEFYGDAPPPESYFRTIKSTLLAISMFLGFITLTWLLRCIKSQSGVQPAQISLAFWVFIFVFTHSYQVYSMVAIGRGSFSTWYVVSFLFSLVFEEGLEQSAYTSFLLVLCFGLGITKPALVKYYVYLAFVAFVQGLFVTFAPLSYPVMSFYGVRGILLKLIWNIYTFVYYGLPFFAVYRLYKQAGESRKLGFEAKYSLLRTCYIALAAVTVSNCLFLGVVRPLLGSQLSLGFQLITSCITFVDFLVFAFLFDCSKFVFLKYQPIPFEWYALESMESLNLEPAPDRKV